MFLKVLKHPLQAKALYLVVFITFIISVILLFFISNSHYTQVEVLHYEKLKKLVDAGNSLIHFSLEAEKKENYNNWKEVELFDNTDIQTELLIEEWGGFSISRSRAKWRDREYSKTALTGNFLFDKEKIGLYLADHGKYLSIAGATKLTGKCYLPAMGIRSVYIDGKPYKGSKLIYGAEGTSQSELPSLNGKFISWLEKGFNGEWADSIGNTEDLYRKDNIIREFSKNSILYESKSVINLSDIKLTGKIIIRSDSLLFVDKSVQAKGIIVIAPIVIIEEGFKGSLQAIASDSLLVEDNVELEYPSMVAVYNPAGNKAFCYISENAIVSGGVLCAAKLEDGKSSELFIQEDALINGLVYCNGSVKLSGSVFGSLYVNRFILRTPRGYYENHLLNGEVDPESQYNKILVPNILAKSNKRGILEWVK